MQVKKPRGFTIIETMLFLAITGVVMATMLMGVGSVINRERYRDAVNSYANFIKTQYSQAMNVSNVRASDVYCEPGRIVSGAESEANEIGTSDCTIIGRIIHSRPDGSGLDIRQVYATRDVREIIADSASQADIDILQGSQLIASSSTEEYVLPWGAELLPVTPGGEVMFTILIVRMPTSGLLHTYTHTTSNSASPSEVVDLSDPVSEIRMCVDPSDFFGNVGSDARNRAVGTKIAENAASSAGVVPVSEGEC